MRVVELLAAAAGGLLLALAFAAPARAGGPTSVLLAAAGSNAVGLYHNDPEYGELSDLVAVNDQDLPRNKDGLGHGQGPFVTVTWLVHDVRVWRVDRIYYDAEGGPWIYTVNNLRRGAAGVWHRSADPEELVDLLQRLHLTGGEYAGPLARPAFRDERAMGGSSDPVDEPSEPVESTSDSAAESSTGDSVSDWWWAGGGVVAGALMGGAAMWLYPMARAGRPERQRLVDF